jgi:two-component system, NtrC family, response regulator HydG
VEQILILDDEPDMIENCRRLLGTAGYECVGTTDPREALNILESRRPDLLLTDMRMPDMDGLELLRRAHEIDPQRPVIMFTAFATIESAVAAVKEGAFDYLSKPFSLDQLRLVVDRALSQRRLMLENLNLREQLRGVYGFENIVGQSHALKQVLELVRKAARSEANLLVLGESGTGKELVARAIHANSPRSAGAFIAVDCASLPENLLESELFGHEKGAFTGAVSTKLGLIELAHKGTLFLDEIGELPSGLQAKLLRVLQERRLRRVGGTREIEVNVRVVSATNRDLKALLPNGHFREDLYYRVNVIDIPLPPLRERKGDVTLLAHTFLKKYGQNREQKLHGFETETLAALEAYSWPGNVRELQNVIERACALTDKELISLADLPEHLRFSQPSEEVSPPPDPAARLTLKEAKERWVSQLEAAYIVDVLKREGGNVSQAARVAGVDRKTLHRLLNKHSLR